MKTTRQAWDFLVTVLTEPIVYLTFLTTSLLVLVSSQQNSQQASLLLAILLMLSAAVFGARMAQIWVSFDETRALRSKGKGVMRQTEQVLSSMQSLEQRIAQVLERHVNSALSTESVVIHLEEFVGQCRALRQTTVNIITVWEDIFPEADLDSQLSELDYLRSRYVSYQKEVMNLDSQIRAARENRIGMDLREKLYKARQKKVVELKETEDRLQRRSAEFDHSLASFLYSQLDDERRTTVMQSWIEQRQEKHASLTTEVIEMDENGNGSEKKPSREDTEALVDRLP